MNATAESSPLVVFLFTDVVESTRRWETSPAEMGEALRRHDALVRATVAWHDGRIFKTIGDAFCVAFERAADAVHAALDIQVALAREDFSAVGGLAVRTAIHAGVVEARDDDFFGPPLNRVARMLGIGHGGQVLATPAALELARDGLNAGILIEDLGAHRLRDIAKPERIVQLRLPSMPATYPALRSLGRGFTNLPSQNTSFVGRETDLAAVVGLVAASRVVTLAGPGGVGKTRLSIAVGRELVDRYPDGVWFVDLAPLTDPRLVAAQVAATLDVRVSPGASATVEIVNALRGRAVVVILDNCEHVLDEALGLVNELVGRCPDVRVLATSREPFAIAGEAAYRLRPLAVASDAATTVAHVASYGAIALFIDRARAVDATFGLTDENVASVVEICRRLDGIPLAIELAAPRIAALSPAQLAARLDERFRLLTQGSRSSLPRQQTLRALVDWSWELLSPRERTIFRRIGVFAGGFTLDAATVVCGDDAHDRWEILDALVALEAKSLVIADTSRENARYHLLETTHAYALERLDESGERAAIAAEHATYVATYLVEASTLWEAMDERGWQEAVSSEIDNVRAALRWTIGGERDPDLGLRVLAPLHQPLRVMLHAEAMGWFEPARDLARDHPDRHLGATILRRFAVLHSHRALPIADRLAAAREALDACDACDDVVGAISAGAMLALLLRDAGQFDEAKRAYERASSLGERYGSAAQRASVAGDWALVEFETGDHARARELIDACIRLAPAGSVLHASALALLADVRFVDGDVAGAREAARVARVAFSAQRVPFRHAVVLCNEAAYALASDDLAEAGELLATALAILEGVGNVVWRTIAIEHHALYAALDGAVTEGAWLAGYGDARLRALGKVREPVEARAFERTCRVVRAALGDVDFERHLATGAELADDEAVGLARAMLERSRRKVSIDG